MSLLTPSRACLLLGIPEPTDTSRLEALIASAESELAAMLGMPQLEEHQATVPAQSSGPYLWARQGHLSFISSISYQGTTFAPDSYRLDDSRYARVLRLNASWPSTARHTGSPDSSAIVDTDLIEIEGTFGFATAPADIELAIALLVQTSMLATTAPGIASQSLGGATVTFDKSALETLPKQVRQVVSKYSANRWIY